MADTMKALEHLIVDARVAGCHVQAGSEDALISGTAMQLAAAGYRGAFPEEFGGRLPVVYANARGETIRHEWHNLFHWCLPLLENEGAPRLAALIAAEGPEDASRMWVEWFRKDRPQLAQQMAEELTERRGGKLARALWLLLSTPEYSVNEGRAALGVKTSAR